MLLACVSTGARSDITSGFLSIDSNVMAYPAYKITYVQT